MNAFALRRATWEQYLPLLDAALCDRWDDVSQITRESNAVALSNFLLHNDLGPTLYWLIKHASTSNVLPAQLLLELMGSARHARINNEQLLQVLGEVITFAGQADISLVALKGLHHTDLLYDGEIDARRIRDIDVLVAPSQREALDGVLLAQGFARGPRLPLGIDRQLAHATQWKRGSIEIDAHHALRIQPGYRLDTEGFIARSRVQDIYSVHARVPTESDTLLLMLLSLCSDLERGVLRARSLVDLWRLLRRCDSSIDWPQFFTVLEKQRLRRPAQAALQVVSGGLPGAMAALGLSDALADVAPVDRSQAVDLLAGKPLTGRRWYMRHGPLQAPAYLAWLVSGMPLRRWLSR